jgi:hypothetical protein
MELNENNYKKTIYIYIYIYIYDGGEEFYCRNVNAKGVSKIK